MTKQREEGEKNLKEKFREAYEEVQKSSSEKTVTQLYSQFLKDKERERKELLFANYPTIKEIHTTVKKQGGWLRVLFGWLITAVAIAMGAPFWFDLLGKVINVRNPGQSISLTKDSNPSIQNNSNNNQPNNNNS